MHNNFDDLHDALHVLKVYSLLVDTGTKSYKGTNTTLEGDEYYEVVIDGIHSCFESTDGDYDEGNDVYLYIFSDRCFTDYYKLCRKYGRFHRIPYNKNPYVEKAKRFIDNYLSGPYTCWHEMRTKRHKPGLHFYHSSDFCYEYQLLERLIDVKCCFSRKKADSPTEICEINRCMR